MIFGAQLVAHAIGDYVLQSDWMAQRKTKDWGPALAHGLTYLLPFTLLTQSIWALLVIGLSHMVIDRYRLARYICWAKNFLAPRRTLILDSYPAQYEKWWHPWKECEVTGYPNTRPPWMAVWLMIATDNILHVLINAAAIAWL